MARKRFNPDDIKGPPLDFGPARREREKISTPLDARALTVSQVNDLIKRTLEERIASPILVVGEISNLNCRNHWYFSLKDATCVINCVAWATSAKRFGFTPQEGQEIVATGHISHYGPQGQTQLYVSKVEPVGAGALDLRFRALCEELRKLGYFDESRKRALPLLPRRIAVITSATGAAVRDVQVTAAERCPAVGLLIVDVRVQGSGAAEQVAAAVRRVNRDRVALGVDAILITRGGGSMEDLWAFNERAVADAILTSELPVVAAIGHETDTTVADLVADVRAATPTQAAMRLVPDRLDLMRQVGHFEHRLAFLARRRLDHEQQRMSTMARVELFRTPRVIIDRARERQDRHARDLHATVHKRVNGEHLRLERAAGRLDRVRPAEVSARRRERLAALEGRLEGAVRRRIRRRPELDHVHRRLQRAAAWMLREQGRELDRLGGMMGAINVQSVLNRGFTYTTLREERGMERLLRSVDDVAGGERLRTHLADGVIESEVRGRSTRGRRTSPAFPKGNQGVEQLDLFDSSG